MEMKSVGLFLVAVWMAFVSAVPASAAGVESVEPAAIEALIASHKKGMLAVSITSLDPNCRPCIHANTDFEQTAGLLAGKARFAQVAWQPWSRFPPELQPFLKQYGITGIPVRLVFEDGKFKDKMVGEPPPPRKPSPLNVSGSVEQIDPKKVDDVISHAKGIVVLMLSSFETDCAFCMRANPLFEALAKRPAAVDAKVRFVRTMYRPWTGVMSDPFGEKYKVNGLPVFITYKDGEPVRRTNGIADVAELERLLLDGLH
jgi:thiol-disulfide isomerase/thioredoxin